MTEKPQRCLNLNRPLAILDFETTGLQPARDRIIDIGILRVQPDGSTQEFDSLINPGTRIPRDAAQVHRITDRHLQPQPTFQQVANGLRDFLAACDLAGFNILGFDLPLLENEFGRARVQFDASGRRIIDVMVIFHGWRSGGLGDAYRSYLGRELRSAHSALADCKACWEILQAQVRRHRIVPSTVEGLVGFCRSLDSGGWFNQRKGFAVFARGKYRGRRLREVAREDPTYLDWMLELPDLRADTRRAIKQAIR